ncbi:GntR family transcriptional regulator [Isoptericola sp. NPDC057191]|uniref:GntR family transcriptional regulator n=1 Tax=Isoptericola sp. NPDC057191 TaxID=3346041 RepID=UPI00363F063A
MKRLRQVVEAARSSSCMWVAEAEARAAREADDDALACRETRRSRLAPMVRPALSSLTSTTLSDQAYASIRAAISNGELPRGAKVTERGLAEMLGVSPTPVREAIARLVQDRQIERVGLRTMRVAEFTDESLEEIDEIEVTLQALTARFAARKATSTDIERLTALLASAEADAELLLTQLGSQEQLDERAARRAFDGIRRFHDEIEVIAGNPVLARLLEQSRAFSPAERAEATRTLTRVSAVGIRERYGDHQALLDVIAAGDEDAAAEIALRHGERSHRDIRRVV